jgi:hypothetical protein
MTEHQSKTAAQHAEHHNKAAECCDNAAKEHREAAKSCTSGDAKKTSEHAKQAMDYCAKATDHGKHALAA